MDWRRLGGGAEADNAAVLRHGRTEMRVEALYVSKTAFVIATVGVVNLPALYFSSILEVYVDRLALYIGSVCG